MDSSQTNWSDQRIESIMGDLLRAGVVLAAGVTLIGGVIFVAGSAHAIPQYQTFHGEPSDLRQVKGVLSAAFSGDGRGIMQLGLLLLIATPVARVVFSLFAFAIQRDRLYVVFTLAVLAVLIFSLTGGQV